MTSKKKPTAPPNKGQTSSAEQSKRFIDMARELGVDETKRGQERAFGKVGMKKPKKARKKR